MSSLIDDQDRIVFDLETQRDFKEVGGRNNLHLLKISVLSFFSFRENKYYIYEEKEITKFLKLLKQNPLVIGFNIRNFDLEVLKPYADFNLKQIKCLDLMDDIINHLGFRLSLDAVAFGTLNKNKTTSGIQAIKWFKNGMIDKIKQYCLQDVQLTKEIYEFGLKNGYIKAFLKNNTEIIKIPVSYALKNEISEKNRNIKEAFESQKRLKIYYVGNENQRVQEFTIEIYQMKGSFIEAFDTKAQKMLLLKIDSINQSQILNESYEIPKEYKPKI